LWLQISIVHERNLFASVILTDVRSIMFTTRRRIACEVVAYG
jgi:hypothetical protein